MIGRRKFGSPLMTWNTSFSSCDTLPDRTISVVTTSTTSATANVITTARRVDRRATSVVISQSLPRFVRVVAHAIAPLERSLRTRVR